MNVVTRFAPSPTGMLHIGSVRTAIFSYLYAKQNKGKFLLRIEDTDKERSTQKAVDVILNGMRLLGLNWDGEEVYQAKNEENHKKFALDLIAKGFAYYAFDTKDELENMRQNAQNNGLAFVYRPSEHSLAKRSDVMPVVRLNVLAIAKQLQQHKIIVKDLVKGDVEFDIENIEDFVILRSDLTPTYMLAVVVDDIEMKVSHIIRGDDHLTNTPKQILLYLAAGASLPHFAHIPLIHDSEGKKLSKRKGAAAVEEYIEMGFLPNALLNYLVKLGWSYGEKEYFTKDEMIEFFNISKVSLSPARFDINKLLNINLYYISQLSNAEMINVIRSYLENIKNQPLNNIDIARLERISNELKKNKTINDIKTAAVPYITGIKLAYNADALNLISQKKDIIQKLLQFFEAKKSGCEFKTAFDEFLNANNLKFKDVGPLFRACLIGNTNSTSLAEIFNALDVSEVCDRLKRANDL